MQTNQRRIAQMVAPLCVVITIGSAWAWALANQASPQNVVTGYGPGIAGQIIEGPITPNCRPEIPCTRPLANATALVLDDTKGKTIGMAVTNERGNFLVSVPSGKYIVRVQVVRRPLCPEIDAAVNDSSFTFVQISCDTGIR